ncbi:MAG: hypothetical protein WD749_03655 [Phycisphaerales bacterium]
MKSAVLRWTIYLLALFVVGPIAGWLTGALRGVDGGPDATPLVCSTPVAGLAAGLGAVVIALVVGASTAALLGVGNGFSAAGLVLAWAAWRTGEIDALIRTAKSSGPLPSLSVEAAIFGAVALGVALAIAAVGRQQTTDPPHRFLGTRPLPVLIVGFLGAAIGAWLVAVTPLKGQAVAAAVVGGILAAAAGRLVDPEAPLPVLALPVLALGIVAPLTGFITKAPMDVVQAAYAGALFPTANVVPMDYIAGAFLGAPVGVSWAASMSSGKVGP